MAEVSCALALLSGVIGAGFASGREIVRFFAMHGRMAPAAAVCAACMLCFFFLRLCTQMEYARCRSLGALCAVRLGKMGGLMCRLLFALLSAMTGGAMLAACAELGALVLPVHHAYRLAGGVSLMLALVLCTLGLTGLALPGAALTLVLFFMLLRLARLPAGEACFLPAMSPDLPVRAAADGAAYGALNAAMLAGMTDMLLALDRSARRRAAACFSLLFFALLSLAISVCVRHLPAVLRQPLPFVHLSRQLGTAGYLLLAAAMYAAAFSTLCTMLASLRRLLPLKGRRAGALSAILCLLFARIGFSPLVESGYPALGALCACLLLVLCLPGCPGGRQQERPGSPAL